MGTSQKAQARNAIMELYRSGEIAKACKRITQGNQLAQDLAQETVLILLEKPAKKIAEMHQRNELKWYTIRIIMVLWRGNWSGFSAKYKQTEPILEAPENQSNQADPEYNHAIDQMIQIMEAEMDSWAQNGAYPYDKNLLLEVSAEGSMTKVSKETKIPYRSVVWTIEKAKTKIRKRIKSHGYDSLSIDS
jgi:DNA-directed RNA polymerase specialized sigma24 family protein